MAPHLSDFWVRSKPVVCFVLVQAVVHRRGGGWKGIQEADDLQGLGVPPHHPAGTLPYIRCVRTVVYTSIWRLELTQMFLP